MEKFYQNGEWLFIVEVGEGYSRDYSPLFTHEYGLIPIHKKHREILDAVLKNSNVEVQQISKNIEVCIAKQSGPRQWEKTANFIKSYDSETTYRLKCKSLLSITDGVTVYEFEKPDFECELLKVVIHQCGNSHFLGYVKIEDYIYSCQWDINGYNWDMQLKRRFNLTPIIKEKPWYEDESNFPCLCAFGNDKIEQARIAVEYIKTEGRLYFDKNKGMYSHAVGWKKIEIETLKIKE